MGNQSDPSSTHSLQKFLLLIAAITFFVKAIDDKENQDGCYAIAAAIAGGALILCNKRISK